MHTHTQAGTVNNGMSVCPAGILDLLFLLWRRADRIHIRLLWGDRFGNMTHVIHIPGENPTRFSPFPFHSFILFTSNLSATSLSDKCYIFCNLFGATLLPLLGMSSSADFWLLCRHSVKSFLCLQHYAGCNLPTNSEEQIVFNRLLKRTSSCQQLAFVVMLKGAIYCN